MRNANMNDYQVLAHMAFSVVEKMQDNYSRHDDDKALESELESKTKVAGVEKLNIVSTAENRAAKLSRSFGKKLDEIILDVYSSDEANSFLGKDITWHFEIYGSTQLSDYYARMAFISTEEKWEYFIGFLADIMEEYDVETLSMREVFEVATALFSSRFCIANVDEDLGTHNIPTLADFIFRYVNNNASTANNRLVKKEKFFELLSGYNRHNKVILLSDSKTAPVDEFNETEDDILISEDVTNAIFSSLENNQDYDLLFNAYNVKFAYMGKDDEHCIEQKSQHFDNMKISVDDYVRMCLQV